MGRKHSRFCVVLLISSSTKPNKESIKWRDKASFLFFEREIAVADDVDASDAEILELLRDRRPDTWSLGWSRAEYESIRQELIVLKKKKMSGVATRTIPVRGLWDFD